MIIWDDGFTTELQDNYCLYIGGRLSSGKTNLAVELAEIFLKKGYKLLSTTQCAWNDPIESMTMDDVGRRKVVIIMDEGGLYFRTAKSANAVGAFLAKQNCYIIFSGKKAPHDDLCNLTVYLRFNFQKWLWLPLKLWRYDVINGKQSYHGFFLTTSWWEYWGVYNTINPGAHPKKIVAVIKKWTKEFFERWGEEYDVSDVETGGGDDFTEFGNELTASARKMGDAAKSIASASRR